MIQLGNNCTLLEDRHDFKDIIWEKEDSVRTEDGVFHNLNKINYPHCFEYCEPWDFHFCGDWYPCDKESAIKDLKINIYSLETEIIKLKNILDRIK